MTQYTEVPTHRTRVLDAGTAKERVQILHEKVWPARTMIINGKRCQVQEVVGGVWRDRVEDRQENTE